MCGLSVLQSSGQHISRVVRLFVWGGVEGYERCLTLCFRKHCMFLTVDTSSLFSISGMCLLNCVWSLALCTVTLCKLVENG